MLESSIWKILSFILILYLLFVFPLLHALERQEDIAYQLAYNEVNIFVDSVRDRGFLSPEMMDGFLSRLHFTGLSYAVELTHEHKQYVPNYSDPADLNTFLGTYTALTEDFYDAEIMDVLYPENPLTPKEQRTYTFNQGDLFSVHVENTSSSLATALKRVLFLQGKEGTKTIITLGGMVQNEID